MSLIAFKTLYHLYITILSHTHEVRCILSTVLNTSFSIICIFHIYLETIDCRTIVNTFIHTSSIRLTILIITRIFALFFTVYHCIIYSRVTTIIAASFNIIFYYYCTLIFSATIFTEIRSIN